MGWYLVVVSYGITRYGATRYGTVRYCTVPLYIDKVRYRNGTVPYIRGRGYPTYYGPVKTTKALRLDV